MFSNEIKLLDLIKYQNAFVAFKLCRLSYYCDCRTTTRVKMILLATIPLTMMLKTKMAGLQGQEVQETHQIGEKFHWNHLTSCGQNVEAIRGIQL